MGRKLGSVHLNRRQGWIQVFGYTNPSRRDQKTHLQYYSKLSNVTITAPVEGDLTIQDIKVPSQREYKGRKPVIESSLADTPCAELGIDGLLETLNSTLGTSFDLTPSLSSLFEAYICAKYDFGTAYGYLRPIWYDCDLNVIQESLRTCEVTDLKIRQEALVGDHITRDGLFMAPRRVWDLFSNRVVPWWVAKHTPWGISHAWMDKSLRENVDTPINRHQWPVPIPKDANLEYIRIELLNLGAEYAWLDVLCLRQKGELREDLRANEWKLDVPTIGNAYTLGKVVCYFSRLGRPLQHDGSSNESYFDSDRSWFKCTWTLQETSHDWMIGGDMGDQKMNREVQERFKLQLSSLQKALSQSADVFNYLSLVRGRAAEKDVDKVAALAYFLPCNSLPAHNDTRPSTSVTCSQSDGFTIEPTSTSIRTGDPTSGHIPAYSEQASAEDAWTALVNVMLRLSCSEMLFLYPEPGPELHVWRPSWKQAMSWKECSSAKISAWVEYDVDTGTYSYNDWHIDLVHVKGLAMPTATPRKGHLIVHGLDGEEHQCEISAGHRQAIPDGIYSLLIGHYLHQHKAPCVVGRLSGQMFTKISVIEMVFQEEKDEWQLLANYLKEIWGSNILVDSCIVFI
ncbi:uncharacterized protein EV420DRAFT_1650561 [Desarmillaria tabescens]|uniref:Heterokaryon incompatibility domain-containing protein n=1 Tax=Armillaria tabescens TaxID=1929756 RepID=A0AA39MNP7_ARMTA|nr:uncharacterized protein EV420DRAFT_1650561 [Desarmillaria tabescens]KAK0440434.1 hypothetical protein EV420DRAFT_1650561 [Desarmillaria tabescens]